MAIREFSSGSLHFSEWKQNVNMAWGGGYAEIEEVFRADQTSPDIKIEITIIGRGKTMEEAYQDLEDKIKAMGGTTQPQKKGK